MLQSKNFGFLQNSNQLLFFLQNQDLNYHRYILFILFSALNFLTLDFLFRKLLKMDQSLKMNPNWVYLSN